MQQSRIERLRDISRFWNWLPAFRAVGETPHLPSAAKAVHLSPSALSRALRQLEKSLGRELFRRAHRRLELTGEGEVFLSALREAMRIVHEASLTVSGERMSGPLRIFSTGVATSAWVLPAALALRAEHPGLVPELTSDSKEAIPKLLTGRLDIAFLSRPIANPSLRTVMLARVGVGVYCGPSHPLHDRGELTLGELQACEFAAPAPDSDGAPQDGWPADLSRRVVIEADRMRLGCEAALAAPLLVVLPDLAAERLGRGRLHKLPLDIVPCVPVYAVLRLAIGREQPADVLLDRVKGLVNATG